MIVRFGKGFFIMLKRILTLDLPEGQSLFLWGARKTGKSTFLKEQFPDVLYIDFLQHDVYLRYSKRPSQLREELSTLDPKPSRIILDEVQKIPEILDEVHWMIENFKGISFILCGSSLRKLKHEGANLLGGRAWRQVFLPLCYPELPSFDLLRIFNHGLLPAHYLSKSIPTRSLQAYIVDYLIPEIQWESRIRQMGSFNRFLDAIAFSNGEALNYTNIARECAVNARTVQAYVDLLVDMLLGYLVFPYTRSKSRQMIMSTPKFFFFDPGIVSMLKGQTHDQLKGADAGHLLEQYVFLELVAYREMHQMRYEINYWRTKSGLEVDFILNRGAVALEVKISNFVDRRDIHGLIEFTKENKPEFSAVVCLEPKHRIITIDDVSIHILPLEEFLKMLWKGEVVKG